MEQMLRRLPAGFRHECDGCRSYFLRTELPRLRPHGHPVGPPQVTDYAGTVHVFSSDGRAVLPNDYIFTAADAGEHPFDGVVLVLARNQRNISTAATADANDQRTKKWIG